MSQFDEDYFMRGVETGKSLYTDYRWIESLTVPMALAIARHLGIDATHDTILDFGCARGYVVKALRHLGYFAYGIDASEWAITNCDPWVSRFVSVGCAPKVDVGWIIAKDVLEHIEALEDTIELLIGAASKGIFVVVPLSDDCMRYAVPDYEKDATHLHRLPLGAWARMFMRPGWEVTASYRVKGVKDNYRHFPTGNGFLTVRRVAE